MRKYRFEMTSSDEGAFGYEPKRLGSNKTVVIEVNEDASLSEMLDHFKSFLSACDFCFKADDYFTIANDFEDDNGDKFDDTWNSPPMHLDVPEYDDQGDLYQDIVDTDLVRAWFDTPEYRAAEALMEQNDSIFVNDGSTLHVSGLNKKDVRDIFNIRDSLIKGEQV